MTVLRGLRTRGFAPRTIVLAKVHQHLEIPASLCRRKVGSGCKSGFKSGTLVAHRRLRASCLAPRARVLAIASPFDYQQVTATSSIGDQARIPRALMFAEKPQTSEMPGEGSLVVARSLRHSPRWACSGQTYTNAHPPNAAAAHADASQLHSFSCRNSSTGRCLREMSGVCVLAATPTSGPPRALGLF